MKIAKFFNVSTDFLLFGGNEANGPTISNTSNSTILQGVDAGGNLIAGDNSGNVTLGPHPEESAAWLTDQEAELLRVFRGFNGRVKHQVMTYVYDLEDRETKS